MLTRKVFLTKTDTTIGFVSQNAKRLSQIKGRPAGKHYIKALPPPASLKMQTRFPSPHKNRIRRAGKTTFVMPNANSYRVVRDPHHTLLLSRLGWAYTTSANQSGKAYDELFAKEASDVIVLPLQQTETPSTILKIGKKHIKRIR
ncbi:MAG TPA: Sua5 YciO YrdC YwlC family protein [Epsilonproteobacteria bacterium]|nr:Sua5 YciO YrdC YwlC family protein [Campylobacterota bacterium]